MAKIYPCVVRDGEEKERYGQYLLPFEEFNSNSLPARGPLKIIDFLEAKERLFGTPPVDEDDVLNIS